MSIDTEELLRMARSLNSRQCLMRAQNTDTFCCRPFGHTGDHDGFGISNETLVLWRNNAIADEKP